ncbi:MAG: tetraacyldisaccharide 4'-kinase, partial [Alphaproteobacteria bacterium]|nr:tetraacyldisaccharide 4'-kinase [Alphaproteobacteria bacterium]
MKTPIFWNQKQSIISLLLIPFSYIWLLASFLNKKKPKKFDIPVIKIGNVVAGGAGKTPTVISLTKKLINSKINTHIILKGYKSSASKSIQVKKDLHTYKEVGDEALLCAACATTWVGKNRSESINNAINNGADLVILDDGLQDESILSNLNIIVFNGYQ